MEWSSRWHRVVDEIEGMGRSERIFLIPPPGTKKWWSIIFSGLYMIGIWLLKIDLAVFGKLFPGCHMLLQ